MTVANSGDPPAVGAFRSSVDLVTVAGIAMIAGVLSTQLHEAGGHGGACLLTGRRAVEWGAFYFDCDTRLAPLWISRLVAAAGSTMNLIVAVLAAGALVKTPRRRPHLSVFFWLMAALNGFQWAGYFLFSGVSGVGDWGDSRDGVFFQAPGWPIWRLLLALGGGLLYWVIARMAVKALAGITGADEAGRRAAMRISLGSYISIGMVAFIIGLMNPIGIYVLLASAVASSFGGPSGLLWAPLYMRKGAGVEPAFALPRRWIWIFAGLAFVLAEGLGLGRSIKF